LHIDVAEGFGDQRPIPARVARGNGPVEYGQEALVGRVRIFGLIASIAGFVEAGPPTLGVAYPPFRRRARRAADLSADCARRQAPAESSTILARCRSRCSVFVERAKPSSSACSSFVNVIGVAAGMLFMHP
jgi:hypothetical protein